MTVKFTYIDGVFLSFKIFWVTLHLKKYWKVQDLTTGLNECFKLQYDGRHLDEMDWYNIMVVIAKGRGGPA